MRDHSHLRPGIRLIAAVCAILGLSGCAPATDVAEREGAPLPQGVAVTVYQSRSDVASGHLQIQIANESGDDITISGAEFAAPQFAHTAIWQKESTVVRAGRTIDLPIQLSEAVCHEGDPAPSVRLTWAVAGDIRWSEVVPVDERGRLEELRAEGCFVEEVSSIARFSLESSPRPVVVSGAPAIELDLTLSQGSGSGGSLLIRSVSGTTLFTHIDPLNGFTSTSMRLDATVDSGTASVVTLSLVPTRCDAHAIAEDKQGTIFAFDVDVTTQDGSSISGTVSVPAPTEIKTELIAFVRLACGTAG